MQTNISPDAELLPGYENSKFSRNMIMVNPYVMITL